MIVVRQSKDEQFDNGVGGVDNGCDGIGLL